jgi:hypothetical protein
MSCFVSGSEAALGDHVHVDHPGWQPEGRPVDRTIIHSLEDSLRRTVTVGLFFALLASPAAGQIAWDSPALISPAVPSGFSLFVTSPAGGDIGALGTYRHAAGPVGLGYRAGIADQSFNDDIAFSGGVDISGFLARGVEGSEVDVIWWAGGGLGIGSETVFTAPLGIILGWTGSGGDVVLSPYGGAHAVLDLSSADGDSVHFDAVVDLGLDIVLSSGWMIRAGGSIGDRETIAIGIKVPGGGGS